MQYSRGTVDVTNGSPTVSGAGTVWLANVAAGDLFTVRKSGVTYEIGSVGGDGTITLTSNYLGQTGAGVEYAISRSFSPIFRIPYPEPRDIEAVSVLKQSVLMYENLLKSALSPEVVTYTTNPTLDATAHRGKIIQINSPATALTLPLAADVETGWRVYVSGFGVTVNRQGSDTINGGASIVVSPGTWVTKSGTGTWTNYDLTSGTMPTFATGMVTFLGAPSSANLRATITDETGTGSLVFANSPELITPVLGVAAATSLALAAGSAGAPSLFATGDTNTGAWFPAADTLAWSTGGTERLRIRSDGNVGIGTTSPGAKLEVRGVINVANSGADAALNEVFRAQIATLEGTGYWRNSIYSSVSEAPADSILKFSLASSQTTQADVMTLRGNGNVGIGTTSPDEALQVSGANRNILLSGSYAASQTNKFQISNGQTLSGGTGYGVALTLISDGSGNYRGALNNTAGGTTTENMSFFGGNVGIGTTSPSTLLTVNGNTGTVIRTGGDNGYVMLGQGQSTTEDLCNVAVAWSSIGLLLNYAVKPASGSTTLVSSYGGAACRASIDVGGIAPGGIAFFTGASQTVAVGGAVTMPERMRIDSSGNVGIGTTSPTTKLVVGDGTGGQVITVHAGASWADLNLKSDATNGGSILWNDGANAGEIFYYHVSDYMQFKTAAAVRLTIDASGHVTPGADNTQNFGSGSLRWGTIYAGTGTINTSDERHKVLREGGELTDAEYRAWSSVRAIVYQDKASFDEWGANAARLHVGYSWQRIKAAFDAEGLQASRYGLWCEDPVLVSVTKTRIGSRQALDEAGQPLFEQVQKVDDAGEPVFETVQETEAGEEQVERIEIVDGVPFRVVESRVTQVPLFDSKELRDQVTGAIVYETLSAEQVELGVNPKARTVSVPRMVRKSVMVAVPVMKDYEEEYTVREPTGGTVGALRYQECAVFEAAWLRRSLEGALVRIEVLEAT